MKKIKQRDTYHVLSPQAGVHYVIVIEGTRVMSAEIKFTHHQSAVTKTISFEPFGYSPAQLDILAEALKHIAAELRALP